MTQLALIDGDILVYRASLKSEKTFDWDNGLYTPVADFEQAMGLYEILVQEVLDALGDVVPLVCFSDPEGRNFRYDVYPAYKAQRHKEGSKKPMVYADLRRWALIESEFPAVFYDCVEGDDAMGIENREGAVICTIDKDLKGIPGRHFNFDKRDLGVQEITQEQADQFFLTQCLAGDPTDGIPGIPGVGMKTAQKILEKGGYTWDTVVKAYEKAKLSEETALTMARLVRILDASLYSFDNNTPILWNP